MTQNDYRLMIEELHESGALRKAAYHFTLHKNQEINRALKDELIQETFESLLRAKNKEYIFEMFIRGEIIGYLIGIMNRKVNFRENDFHRKHIKYYRLKNEYTETTKCSKGENSGDG